MPCQYLPASESSYHGRARGSQNAASRNPGHTHIIYMRGRGLGALGSREGEREGGG